jgi:hypothetical protein
VRRSTRGFGSLLLALLLAWTAGANESAAAEDLEGDQAAALKAAFVLNFARYTEWPAESFRDADDPIEIWVLGDEKVADALAALAERAAPVSGRRLSVRSLVVERLDAPARLIAELKSVQVLFVGREVAARSASFLLAELNGAPLLTVGDTEGFAAAGGMLGLVPEQKRFVFDANPQAIARSGIELSARVLKLARSLEKSANR